MNWISSFLFLLSVVMGITLFQVKHRCTSLEAECAQITSRIQETQESLKVLKAEWSYLSEPQRLQRLSEKFLSLRPAHASQIVTFEDLVKVVEEETLVQAVLKGHVIVAEEPDGS